MSKDNLITANITGATAVYAIIGDPVSHSLSPLMQNAAFAACGIPAVYIPFHVTSDGLAAAIAGIRALNIRGVNVTVPHKEEVCTLLDEVEGSARLIGAVNTIVNCDGRLIGYNTDGVGLVHSLKNDLQVDLNCNTEVVVLGAGGAARAAIVALAQHGVKRIVIVNRTLRRAQGLVERYSPCFPGVVFTALPLGVAGSDCAQNEIGSGVNTEVQFSSNSIENFKKCNLIVSSTSIGLSGEYFNVLPWEHLNEDVMVYDMIYSSQTTPLVRAAQAAGIRACDGLGMLTAQGEAAFELWSGRNVAGLMRGVLDQYVASVTID